MQLSWTTSSAGAVCFSIICMAYLHVREEDSVTASDTAQYLEPNASSSLFCEGNTPVSRQCVITNLCFVPADSQFVMIESADTRYIGVRNASDLQPLLKLNPVVDHNLFDLSLVPVASQWLTVRRAVLYRGDFIVFEPFKPDNLMHAIHDDLLPAYLTLYHLCHGDMAGCTRRWRPLLRADALPPVTLPLYTTLLGDPLTLTGDLDPSTPHCFERAHLGLRSDSLWYQYGFERPQSPLATPRLQREHLEDFRMLMLSWLAEAGGQEKPTEPSWTTTTGYVLLLSRTKSRRILNEAELSTALSARLGLPVHRLALEETSVAEAAELAAGAALLVGMHGAGLALALFLPPGAAVLELFPYGLHPQRYQPYRRLCQLRRLGYRAWVNRRPEASVPPPETAPADLGGLGHLPVDERRRIDALQEVPDTLCCDDAAFLYRVYQDTTVDVAAASDAAAAALDSIPPRPRRGARGALFFPGPPRHLTAEAEGESRLLQWRPPLNAPSDRSAAAGVLGYRLWVRQGERVKQYRVRQPRVTVPASADCEGCPLQVWVQSELDGRTGPLVHGTFQLSDGDS